VLEYIVKHTHTRARARARGHCCGNWISHFFTDFATTDSELLLLNNTRTYLRETSRTGLATRAPTEHATRRISAIASFYLYLSL